MAEGLYDSISWVGGASGRLGLGLVRVVELGGGQVVIYLHAGGSAYYRFYHGPMIIPGDRPDVTIAAACNNPSRYFGQLQNEPDDPMSAHVTFR